VEKLCDNENMEFRSYNTYILLPTLSLTGYLAGNIVVKLFEA
jgi:hypothetical protein